jgi:hypothetical protein
VPDLDASDVVHKKLNGAAAAGIGATTTAQRSMLVIESRRIAHLRGRRGKRGRRGGGGRG